MEINNEFVYSLDGLNQQLKEKLIVSLVQFHQLLRHL